MSDEITQNVPDGPSFEERVLTRLDAIQERLQALEDQAERRAMDTKPIWERALAEILEVKEGLAEVKEGLGDVERKLEVLSRDIVKVHADQVRAESRLDKLESKPM
jgi:chromosome segregation ATPase